MQSLPFSLIIKVHPITTLSTPFLVINALNMNFELGDPKKLVHDVATISCCAVAATKSLLATGCQDGSICLWELLRGELITKMVAPVDIAPKTYKAGPNGAGMYMVKSAVSFAERQAQVEGLSDETLFEGPAIHQQGGDEDEVEEHLSKQRYNTLGTLGRPSSLILHTPKKNHFTGLATNRALATDSSSGAGSPSSSRNMPVSNVSTQKLFESRQWRIENPYYDPNVEDERYFHSRMAVNGLSFNHDASVLVSVGEDGSMYLWDMTAVHAAMLEFHEEIKGEETEGLAEFLATANRKDSKHKKSVAESRPKWNDGIAVKWRKLTGHDGASITSCIFSPSSLIIATGSKDCDVMLWGSLGRPVCGRLRCHSNWITCLAFSSDSEYLASGSYDKSVGLWSAQLFQLIRVIRVNHYPVHCVGFSVENSVIASGDGQGNLILCRTTDGVCLRVLKGHFGPVTSVIFAESLGGIITTSEDTSMKVWSLRGECLHSFKAHEEAVTSAVLSLFDEVIITTSEDYEARVWPVTLADKTFTTGV